MRTFLRLLALSCFFCGGRLFAATLQFSGYEWEIKSAGVFGPGPNLWRGSNVWLDASGHLHLKIANENGRWSCAEVTTVKRLGFGTYHFEVSGPLDYFDQNIVLGLFNYPTPDVGDDGTNEIDIEIARWGNPAYPSGNFTVWPPLKGEHGSHTFNPIYGTDSTHRFTWRRRSIVFQSRHGGRRGAAKRLARFAFKPKEFTKLIPQHPMPVHINLWLFRGQAPADGREVEVIIRRFTFKKG